MSSNTTQTTIVNRALQILGQPAVSSIQDNDRGARSMNRAYYPVRDAMLRENYWSFAIKRASLTANAQGPAFGPSHSYNLPGDFLDLAPVDSNGYSGFGVAPYSDFIIEGGMILTSQTSPIQIRYISNQLLESAFDASFAEAFAARLAMAACEEITQSNSKLQACGALYEDTMETAKKRSAFESQPVESPTSSWLAARY